MYDAVGLLDLGSCESVLIQLLNLVAIESLEIDPLVFSSDDGDRELPFPQSF